MTEWGVVLVLIALAGLFVTVGGPVIKLNSAITKQSVLLESLDKQLEQISKDKTEAHRRLWAHNEEQDKVLNDHESRIRILERNDAHEN